jgi:hypothetical protein
MSGGFFMKKACAFQGSGDGELRHGVRMDKNFNPGFPEILKHMDTVRGAV